MVRNNVSYNMNALPINNKIYNMSFVNSIISLLLFLHI